MEGLLLENFELQCNYVLLASCGSTYLQANSSVYSPSKLFYRKTWL